MPQPRQQEQERDALSVCTRRGQAAVAVARGIGKSGNASRGRSVGKALALFQVDPTRWPELASDRGAWRRMLESGIAPAAFRPQARPLSPRISRNKTARSCMRATMA